MSNLKRIREANNLSQSQLAERSGVTLRSIQVYEQNHRDINKSQAIVLYKLSKALGCKIEDLLNIEGVDKH